MVEAEVEVRRWGNSLGVIIPAELAREEGLEPRDRVLLRVSKVRYPEPAFFGSMRGAPVAAQAAKDRLRREHGR